MNNFGLQVMLAELEGSALQVVLVPTRRPANEGGMIRVAVSRNADWYRKFCAAHSSARFRRKAAFDTCIKRRNVVAVINRLLSGGTRSKYAPELIRIAARYAQEAVA